MVTARVETTAHLTCVPRRWAHSPLLPLLCHLLDSVDVRALPNLPRSKLLSTR